MISVFIRRPSLRAATACRAGLGLILFCSSASADPPGGFALEPTIVAENTVAASVVGNFSATDPDGGTAFAYALIPGADDDHNGLFSIHGDQLILQSPPDFEIVGAEMKIRVQVTDAADETTEKSFILTLTDDRAEDIDGDGINEAAEEDIHGTSDTAYDSDGDGFGDPYEIANTYLPADPASHPPGSLVIGWGDNAAGQALVPPGAGDVISIAAGAAHSLALRSDGTVFAWGSNADGQCDIPPGLAGVIAIGAGDRHSLAVTANGRIVGWGANESGQISPPSWLENVVAVAGGGRHSIALKSDGKVVMWGANDFSQSTAPADLSEIVAIAAARDQCVVIFSSGSIQSWGRDDDSQSYTPSGLNLGLGCATGERHTLMLRRDGIVIGWGAGPDGQLNPPAELTDAVAISTRGRHNLAIRANRTVVGWGAGELGQTAVPFEARNAKMIAAGTNHSLVLRSNEGFPEISSAALLTGQVGTTLSHQVTVANATATSYSAMILPAGLSIDPQTGLISGTLQNNQRRSFRVFANTDRGMLTQLVFLTLGDEHPPTDIVVTPPAVMENAPAGSVVATLSAVDPDMVSTHVFELVPGAGSNDNYRFAISGDKLLSRYKLDIDFEKSPSPFPIRIRAIDSAGSLLEVPFLIGMLDDRTEDGDGDGLSESEEEDIRGTSDSDFDSDNDGVGDGVEIVAGYSAVDPEDWPEYPLIAWGSNPTGELQPPFFTGVTSLALGQTLGMAIGFDGGIIAWGGLNTYGQRNIPSGLGDITAIAVGGDAWAEDSAFGLALRTDGTVAAWGYGFFGQTSVPAGLSEVVGIAAGRDHGMALKSNGTVVSWGANFFGQRAAPEGLAGVVAIAAGGYQSLALKKDGTVAAWGSFFNGTQWEDNNVPPGLADVIAISAGRFHCLALKRDGTVVAWGNGELGQTTVPLGLQGVVAISAGGFHSTALRSDGSLVVWGLNDQHQGVAPGPVSENVKLVASGLQNNIAIRGDLGFPSISSSREITAALGSPLHFQITISDAVASAYSAAGLPTGITLDSLTGVISGPLNVPVRDLIRIQVDTNKGRLTQLATLSTISGPPVGIALSPAEVLETAPADTVVGTLAALDPDPGESHVFSLAAGTGGDDNHRFLVQGSTLVVKDGIDIDYETHPAHQFSIRVRAVDEAANVPYEQILTVRLLNDWHEDPDGNNHSQAVDMLLSWAQAGGLAGDDRLPQSKPHGDGVSNLVKYAFGLNPGSSANAVSPGVPAYQAAPPDGVFRYLRRKNSGLTYLPRCSTSLTGGSFAPMTGTPTVVDIDEVWERVTYHVPAGPAMFFVVEVSIE